MRFKENYWSFIVLPIVKMRFVIVLINKRDDDDDDDDDWAFQKTLKL